MKGHSHSVLILILYRWITTVQHVRSVRRVESFERVKSQSWVQSLSAVQSLVLVCCLVFQSVPGRNSASQVRVTCHQSHVSISHVVS